ncbi:hypothetical protein H2200_004551 [Cladophialophora chaetospira]|uniref:Microbial-type PARG catalytic domain-containing protein n=1 Tax=Cladophialophora chaetospira TaxID=386627 RepID=A0AA38XDE4_9EURO|nr:hypothetical protein H2200_004551 [Cladophialophora chaetospira]
MAPNNNRPRVTNNLPADRYQGRASFGQEPPEKDKRVVTAEDTLAKVPEVLRAMQVTHTQPRSVFYSTQLPPLDAGINPGHIRPNVKVLFGDTTVLARQLLGDRPDYRGKLAVLNCASDAELAGRWRHRYGTTQEDALCYSSTLWPELNQFKDKYPWRKVLQRDANNMGECAGIFSPDVVIFKDELAKDCEILRRKDWTTISMVSVAALACPPIVAVAQTSKRKEGAGELQLKLEKDVRSIQERWRMTLRMAGEHGKSVLLLAALGCGVWKCPPRQVAELLQECLAEPEFEGWFEEICVGIYDKEVCRTWAEVFPETDSRVDVHQAKCVRS